LGLEKSVVECSRFSLYDGTGPPTLYSAAPSAWIPEFICTMD